MIEAGWEWLRGHIIQDSHLTEMTRGVRLRVTDTGGCQAVSRGVFVSGLFF